MSARFELERSTPAQTENYGAVYAQLASQNTGLGAEFKASQTNTADKHLPDMKLDCGQCSVDSTGKAVNERKDYHDARDRVKKTYEEKFRNGEPVKLEYGATIWDVAEARLTVEKGHKPSAQEIMKESAAILQEIKCGPCDNIIGKVVSGRKPGMCESTAGDLYKYDGGGAPAACEAPPPGRVVPGPKSSDRHPPAGPDDHGDPSRHPGDRKPSDRHASTGSSDHGEPSGACGNERKAQHGRVEKHDNVTVIKEDNGATETIKTDDKGNPVEVTRQGGHWAHKEHFKKTGEHEWTDDRGGKWHGDVALGKDGTYSYTDLDKGFTKVYRPDGSRYDQTVDGRKTFIQSPDGNHQHSYLRGQDGKWQESPGGEKFNDVGIKDDGTVIAKGKGITKVLRPDGSQIDTADDGRQTFILTPDGANQKAYELDNITSKWHEKGTNNKYNYVQMDENGVVTARNK